MSQPGEVDIRNPTYKIYILAVCFVTLICAAITTGVVLYNLVKIAAPEMMLDSHAYNAHQSMEAFKRSPFYLSGRAGPALIRGSQFTAPAIPLPEGRAMNRDDVPEISDQELEALRAESYGAVLRGHQRGAVQSIIRSCIILLVSLSLFLVHWRLFRRMDPVEGREGNH